MLLVRENDGEQVFVQKILKGRHEIYTELLNCPHPYLPKLYEVVVSEDVTTIIEEYIEGQPLGCEELSEKQLLCAIRELCSVLDFLHGRGVIHRDIKPSNLILAKDGHIRLIDFDAARMGKGALEQEQDTRLLGTRGYAPPEQYGFAQTDTRADIYSLGVTIKQLLGAKAERYCYKKIIKKCTDLNPDRRYQSVKQVQRAFAFPYRSYWYLPAALVVTCILCGVFFNSSQEQQLQETLLFEAQKSEYIIMSEMNVEQGKTAEMEVDMTGNGDIVNFLITFNKEHQLTGTNAKSADGIDTGLWYPSMQELLYGIPYKQQYSDKDSLIQITCADADGDGIKEVFVTRGDGKQAVVTFVWQFIPGGNGSPDQLLPIGTMWGVTTMRLVERGEIKINVHNLLPELICYYDNGFLGELEGIYLSTYKEFQENEYAKKNNLEQKDRTNFDLLESFPAGEQLFEDYNVKWGVSGAVLNTANHESVKLADCLVYPLRALEVNKR